MAEQGLGEKKRRPNFFKKGQEIVVNYDRLRPDGTSFDGILSLEFSI